MTTTFVLRSSTGFLRHAASLSRSVRFVVYEHVAARDNQSTVAWSHSLFPGPRNSLGSCHHRHQPPWRNFYSAGERVPAGLSSPGGSILAPVGTGASQQTHAPFELIL